jgi:integrase
MCIRDSVGALRQLVSVNGDLTVYNITPKHLDKVFARHSWQTGTRNNKLTHYKVFFAWCRARGYMQRDNDPAYGWRVKRVVGPEKTRIPFIEWPRLFAACRNSQEETVLACGLYLFLRGSELRCIKLKHIHLSDSEIEVYRPKTRDWDTMPISAELAFYVRKRLTFLTENGIVDPEAYFICTRTRPQPMKGIQGFKAHTTKLNPNKPIEKPFAVVQAILGRAGYPTENEGEHTLRRSGARAYFDYLAGSGYDGALRRVQSMLGHSNSAMTEVYLGLDLDRRQRNADIKGRLMFPAHDANIVPIRGVSNGS